MAEEARGGSDVLHKDFFTIVQHNFPEIVNGKIKTASFLQSSRDLVVLIDNFGKVFSPITYDMNKNIEKLSLRYLTDTSRFEELHDMILIEKENGDNLATDALLWLRRAVHMVYLFFRLINDDHYNGTKTEDLAPFLRKAYVMTLESFHGWMSQQLFSFLVRFSPSRTELVKILSHGEEIHEESVMKNLKDFLDRLQFNIDELVNFYAQNNFESNGKV